MHGLLCRIPPATDATEKRSGKSEKNVKKSNWKEEGPGEEKEYIKKRQRVRAPEIKDNGS